jgi:hypothetical protein
MCNVITSKGRAKSVFSTITSTMFLGLLALGLAGSANASLTPCGSGGVTYNLGTSTTPNSGALVAPGANSAGCEQVDKEFSGFNYTNGGTLVDQVAGSAVPVLFVGSSPTTGISAVFGNTGFGAAPTWSVSTNGTTTSAIIPYDVTVDPASSLPDGQFFSITSMALNSNVQLTSPAGASDSITIIEYFCGGGAAACVGGGTSTGGILMTAPTAGFLEFNEVGNGGGATIADSSCFNNGGSSCTVNGSNVVNFGTFNFTDVYVTSNVALSSGGAQVAVNWFQEEFFQDLEAPEPATFGLMGVALAGLGFLRLRKRT